MRARLARAYAAISARWAKIPPARRDLLRRGFHSAWQAAAVLLAPLVLRVIATQSVVGISVPWRGVAVAAVVAASVSWVTSALSWKVPALPPAFEALVRGLKTTAAFYVAALTATGVDLLHFDWGAMLTGGLVAGLVAAARYAITLGWFGGPATQTTVTSNLRSGNYLLAAAVGDGTTVTPAGLHDVAGEHAATPQGATFEPEEILPDDPRLAGPIADGSA